VSVVKIARHDDEAGPDAALAHLDALLPRVAGKHVEQTVAYERAKRLAALDKTEAARDAYLAIADKWPYPFGSYFDDSLYYAAKMEEKLGRPEAAIADLERLLHYRETSSFMGSYERPKYIPALLEIADLYETKLHDRARARETLHRLYADFTTSPLRDDALWREAELWREDGDASTACKRLSTLTSDFPDSRYVPCAVSRCPGLERPSKSKAPKECRPYIERGAAVTKPELPVEEPKD
jgi:tetratricopeptide (TPR) repeat protein